MNGDQMMIVHEYRRLWYVACHLSLSVVKQSWLTRPAYGRSLAVMSNVWELSKSVRCAFWVECCMRMREYNLLWLANDRRSGMKGSSIYVSTEPLACFIHALHPLVNMANDAYGFDDPRLQHAPHSCGRKDGCAKDLKWYFYCSVRRAQVRTVWRLNIINMTPEYKREVCMRVRVDSSSTGCEEVELVHLFGTLFINRK